MKSKQDAEKTFNKYGYSIVDNYVNCRSKCKCKCMKCGQLTILSLHHIEKKGTCKNCIGLEIKEFFSNNKCELLSEPSRSKSMEYVCSCGNKSKIRWYNFKNGERCRKCSGKRARENDPKKLNVKNYIHDYFKKEGCKLLENDYVNQETAMKYVCSCGTESTITWRIFRNGHRCHKCAKEKVKSRYVPFGSDHHNWNPDREQVEINKKVRGKIKSALRRTLRILSKTKTDKMFNILKYTKNDLVKSIIEHPLWKFVRCKNWELDHYFPIKAFIDYGIYDESIINSLDNLRPIEKDVNRKKSDSYDNQEFEKWLKTKGIL